MNYYWVKCKIAVTSNARYTLSKNNKPSIKGKCVSCIQKISIYFNCKCIERKNHFDGFLILAELSAAGSLVDGEAWIATAKQKSKAVIKILEVTKKHNKAMEGNKAASKNEGFTFKTLQEVAFPYIALSQYDLPIFANHMKLPNFRGFFIKDESYEPY